MSVEILILVLFLEYYWKVYFITIQLYKILQLMEIDKISGKK